MRRKAIERGREEVVSGSCGPGKYLAQDRGDIQYAGKELARGMSTPSEVHGRIIKSLGRHLLGRTRYVMKFQRQGRNSKMHTPVD